MNGAAGNILDKAVYRCEDLPTCRFYFGPLGLPALAGVGVGVAMIWTLCVLWVIRLQYRLTAQAGKMP